MSTLCIITARGGSKRIPKKNIKEFCGKPIIAYSIETALHSGVFDEVMASTDSEEIAEIARKYGANVPFMRSEATANDFASTDDVLKEVLSEYEKRGQTFDFFCCIYPTAPLISEARMLEAYELVKKDGVGATVSVVKFGYPPQRAYVIEDGEVVFQQPKYEYARSQDLTPIYHDAGQFYFYRTSSYFSKSALLCDHTVPVILDELEVQDIDTMEDWHLAELKYKMLQEKGDRI